MRVFVCVCEGFVLSLCAGGGECVYVMERKLFSLCLYIFFIVHMEGFCEHKCECVCLCVCVRFL